jgi:hypothetical protein
MCLTLTKFAFEYRSARTLTRICAGRTPNDTIRCHSDRRAYLATMAIPAMLIGSAPLAQAGYIVTLAQEGSNVVATGSGTLDVADLGSPVPQTAEAQILPSSALIATGEEATEHTYGLASGAGVTGPTSFGSGGLTFASSSSGDIVGIEGRPNGTGALIVPSLYTSSNPLSDTATYDNATFSSLGATPGTYVWTWGSGPDADSFTLQIGAVPAPGIGRGLPVLLAIGGLLFAAKLLERSKRFP